MSEKNLRNTQVHYQSFTNIQEYECVPRKHGNERLKASTE